MSFGRFYYRAARMNLAVHVELTPDQSTTKDTKDHQGNPILDLDLHGAASSPGG
jgi:hypothetical protein